MRSRSVISLAIALVLGLVAALLARSLIQPENQRPVGKQTIVVATQPIGVGVALTPENVRELPWAGDSVIEGAFASIVEMNKDGRRLTLASLQRNEPVLASKVTLPNQRATLSTQIDEGMRAVTIRVDEVRGVAGFILPGDRVDVILTKGENGQQETAYADVLLQNAKVLAIDQSVNERADKPAVARAVTLEVTVSQAQSVILAQGIGRLSLVLRQSGETVTRPTGRITAADITTVGSRAGADRVTELERQLSEMRKAAEQSNEKLGEGSRKLTELEARIREELARPQVAVPPVADAPVAPSPRGAMVTVVRNGQKREQYTVIPEQ